jgi:hypothetical protein
LRVEEEAVQEEGHGLQQRVNQWELCTLRGTCGFEKDCECVDREMLGAMYAE